MLCEKNIKKLANVCILPVVGLIVILQCFPGASAQPMGETIDMDMRYGGVGFNLNGGLDAQAGIQNGWYGWLTGIGAKINGALQGTLGWFGGDWGSGNSWWGYNNNNNNYGQGQGQGLGQGYNGYSGGNGYTSNMGYGGGGNSAYNTQYNNNWGK